MRQPTRSLPTLKDILFLDKLITGPIVNLMYWAGLGMIVLAGFGVIGASVGLLLREGLMGLLVALPTLVAGLLAIILLVAIWRGFCEFYLVVFRISEDLRALRAAQETQGVQPQASRFPPNP